MKRVPYVLLVLLLAWAMRYCYRDIIDASRFWEYLKIIWFDSSPFQSGLFFVLGVLPALFVPLRLRQPSDLAASLLFLMVHLPIVTLLPHVSETPPGSQLTLAIVSNIVTLMLFLPGRLSYAKLDFTLPPLLFWTGMILVYFGLWLLVYSSGRLSFSSLNFVDVYEDRLDLREVTNPFGALYHYAMANTMYAIGPFIVAVGLYRRSVFMIGAGLALLLGVFAATTFKAAYMAFFLVVSVYAILKFFPKYIGLILVFGLLSMIMLGAWIDIWAFKGEEAKFWESPPTVSWMLFFRMLGNSAFLNAAYFDFFLDSDKLLYSQSFLRFLIESPLDTPVARLIGELYTGNPENNANVNIFSDAFANAGYWGIIGVYLILTLYLVVFNLVCSGKSFVISSLLLITPFLGLSNLGLHTNMMSGGMIMGLLIATIMPFNAQLQRRKRRRSQWQPVQEPVA